MTRDEAIPIIAHAMAQRHRGERVQLHIRVPYRLWKRLRDAAYASGRSYSAEAEYRLEREFWKLDHLEQHNAKQQS